MIRSIYFTGKDELRLDIPVEQYSQALQDTMGILWVDFEGEESIHCEDILLKTFGFHPLAVDDALRETHVPKVDDWDDYIYIVLQAIHYHPGMDDIDTQELDIFMSHHYLVTYHDLPIPALKRVWEACQRDPRHFHHGADRILYRVTDEITADYMQVVEGLDEEIEHIEDVVFSQPSPSVVQRIFTLKRATLHLRRMISPLREVLNRLARDNYSVIDERERIYFRDVYDHLVRLHDISESLRDLVSGVLDTYLSVINNRMNEIMKTLTIITTLFMPLSFVAGFFGMNFFLPKVPISSFMEVPVFAVVLILFIGLPFLMFLWVRRRGWM